MLPTVSNRKAAKSAFTPIPKFKLRHCHCKRFLDVRKLIAYVLDGDPELQEQSACRSVGAGSFREDRLRMHERILRRLDRLEVSARAEEMNVPGFDFHPLKGLAPVRYTVHVNGPWGITFEFDAGDAFRVDLEQYHRGGRHAACSPA